MTNILQLRNTLKNLSDEQLQQELNSPTGAAPPFLVLAESNRRAEMRKSYEAEQRRRGEGRTTVAEDVMGAQGPVMPPQNAAPSLQTGMPSFANGGPVGLGAFTMGGPDTSGLGAMLPGAGYGHYRQRIEDMLAKSGAQADTNRALALIEAGFGIAGGRSPDFATNVGQGGIGALQGYRRGLRDAQTRELGLLQAAANLSGRERAEQIQLMDLAQRGRIAAIKAGKPTDKEKQITALRNRGMSQVAAEDIAYGRVKVATSETGDPILVNVITGDSRPVKQDQLAQAIEEEAQQNNKVRKTQTEPVPPDAAVDEAKPETLWKAASGMTGLVPALQEGATQILGQLTDDPNILHPEVVEKRQKFRTAFGSMARALSVNPKMPVAEIKRIREEFKIEPRIFDSETALRARMRSMDSSLKQTLKQQERAGQDRTLSKKDRLSARANARAIRDFLSTMGVPVETELERELRRRGRLQ